WPGRLLGQRRPGAGQYRTPGLVVFGGFSRYCWMTEPQMAAVADELTAAVMANDSGAMSQLYGSDAVAWHGTDRNEMSIPQLFGFIRMIDRVATCEIQVRNRFVTDVGFVQPPGGTYRFAAGGSM